MCLCTCVRHAEGDELRRFQDIARGRAAGLATGRYSNYFVQRVLDRGSTPFRQELVRELMREVALLSRDPFGNYVVQHCFLNQETGLPQAELLPIVLRAFAGLPQQQLQGLVHHAPGNLVLCSLLETGINHCPELTRDLASRIDLLDRHVLEHPHSQMVMWFVERILLPQFFTFSVG
ncbi:pumilio homolog 2 [Triticum aestivum]|uniref:pumilio homolog 2 n=1 Tax=Triticum aestivum TaxID=4565 RepID=UPI001D00E67E|nr:pumilio homolog 2-like [Triticum aestivum]